MNRTTESLQLNAYLDGELELTRAVELEAAYAADPALRTQLEQLRELSHAVREHAEMYRAPPALRRDITALLDAHTRRSERAATPAAIVGGGWRRWFAWESYAAGLASAAVIAIAVHAVLLPTQDVGRIQDEVLASHARAVVAQRLVDVPSSDHHTVKPWLSGRLDFSPPVDPPAGSKLLGARVDYVDDRPVAAVVFQHAGHLVDVYAWPVRTADSAPVFTTERGMHIAHWTRGGLRQWVVSDLNAAEFDAFVQALARGA